MRVLFVHAADGRLTPEHKVHLALAASAAPQGVESSFIWQSSAGGSPHTAGRGDVRCIDFGRDMSLTPPPKRLGRARLMATRLPRGVLSSLREARRVGPQVVYTSQQQLDLRVAQVVSRLLGLPHAIHIHYNVGPWLGRYALGVILRSRHLVAVSEYIRQTALLEGVPPGRITTILNTIATVEAEGPVDRRASRERLGFPVDSEVVVAAGRLDPHKGHLQLIEALQLVVAQRPQARLLVCGASTTRDGHDRRLERRVAELGLSGHVHFAGHVGNLGQVLSAADAFCLPTELEPFGLVFLEAMAAGLPVLACYSGAVPEIVVHGTTGLLSYPGDVEGLAANLLSVLGDPALASRMGSAGRERARSQFRPEDSGRRWARWLRTVTA